MNNPIENAPSPFLRVENLKKYFSITSGNLFSRKTGVVKAVDGVSFSVFKGEAFGLVGESGCGKSTVGKTIIRLMEPTEGRFFIDGEEMTKIEHHGLRLLRQRIQIIFQDPYSSLNPSMTIGHALREPLLLHKPIGEKEAYSQVLALMKEVGLDESHYYRYPYEFSGGQRQRIGIARALAVNPELIIADEPVSALDVSVQAQILRLLKEIQQKYGLSFIFIAHNLAVVKLFCDRIAVMYLGRIIEMAKTDELFAHPLHPYTLALLEAVPISNPLYRREKQLLRGEIPSPLNPPPGCHFHPRCPRAENSCKNILPQLEQIAPQHWVACHPKVAQ